MSPPLTSTVQDAGPVGVQVSPHAAARVSPQARLPHWAVPLPGHGVPNLHRVAPTLLRSAQPPAASVPALRALGVRTVLSFRSFNRDEGEIVDREIRLLRVPFHTWYFRARDLVRALELIIAAERDGPVLIHCMHGSDRTGLVSALYRMVVQGWDKEAALREMRQGGYGFHSVWRNIPAFVARVDADALRAALRIAAP